MNNDRFVEIGRIAKPKGLDGVIRFQPGPAFSPGLLDQLQICYMKNDRGDMVPARIESVEIESKRNRVSFFVKFDMITDRSQAMEAVDRPLYADVNHLPEVEEAGLSDSSLFGYIVRYNDKKIGEVVDVIENPAHPILEVKLGNTTMLIPQVDEYIQEVNHEKGIINCIRLDQLIDQL